ncbi:SRPBCC family protein [Halobacillus salinarum]|uniref:SRPBCC family protein n=1 Tax=Halobacillus salinarum TaxID=2932257 RepID=A0ABY4EMR8_9BACI|nr:SRPBCC family protein [Halobacillus salinarum]UOQ44954.1 SRPBCC family protein [Halobacillus salinarum]
MNDFVYVTYIRSSRLKVWEALTSGSFTRKYFFGRDVVSEWTEGARVVYLRENGELDVEGEVLQANPFERLSFTWRHAGDTRSEPTIVTFILEEMNETVKLTLHHERLMDGDLNEENDTFRGLNNGWPAILSNLKSYLETGETLTPMDIK